jgi:hypothetical protein
VSAAAGSGDEELDRPLGSYAAVISVYGGLLAAFFAFLRRSRRRLPDRVAPLDLAMVTVATHKLSRRLAKDAVTSPIRAPFTRATGVSGPAELAEEVQGGGIRRAVGELLTCPFCLDQWVATGFVCGLTVAPRATRLVAATFTAVAGADFLQLAYAASQQAGTKR